MICMITLRIRNDPHFSSLHSPSSILLPPSSRPSFIISFLVLHLSFFASPSHIFTSHSLPRLPSSLHPFFILIPSSSFLRLIAMLPHSSQSPILFPSHSLRIHSSSFLSFLHLCTYSFIHSILPRCSPISSHSFSYFPLS